MSARRRPIGAEVLGSGTHFRVWAPASPTVRLVVESPTGDEIDLTPTGHGYFEGTAQVARGAAYRFRLADGKLYADPASRYQPDGPEGPSMVIDPIDFPWTDQQWRGVDPVGLVVYEIHVGTFTPEGTWAAAMDHLPTLRELGVNLIEIMPIGEFAGAFGWGYDGVLPFAPFHHYGHPDDVRRFVDRAHALGLGVILDVVYNHSGPAGSVYHAFAPEYFSTEKTDWGSGFDFACLPVREYFESNAAYWIDEFHLDGLRLDAIDQIVDHSSPHIIRTVAEAARRAAGHRRIWIVGENEQQTSIMVRPISHGGHGLDAVWADDFHHAASVAATERCEAYCSDFRGTPQEFIAAATGGHIYQGQWSQWQQQYRGTPTTGVPLSAFVAALETHDQTANEPGSVRLHRRTTPGMFRALSTLLLLGPWTPMLFQGQEFLSSAPFLYFADHVEPLRTAVREGREQFLAQFPSLMGKPLPADPADVSAFERCKLDHAERSVNFTTWSMYQSLIALRRTERAFARQSGVDLRSAVIGPSAFVLRFDDPASDRLLIVNLGERVQLTAVPYPVLGPGHTDGRDWTLRWSSDDVAWGGPGPRDCAANRGWTIPAESAWVLA